MQERLVVLSPVTGGYPLSTSPIGYAMVDGAAIPTQCRMSAASASAIGSVIVNALSPYGVISTVIAIDKHVKKITAALPASAGYQPHAAAISCWMLVLPICWPTAPAIVCPAAAPRTRLDDCCSWLTPNCAPAPMMLSSSADVDHFVEVLVNVGAKTGVPGLVGPRHTEEVISLEPSG